MMPRGSAIAAIVSAAFVFGSVARADSDAPPPSLISGEAGHGAVVDPVLAHLNLQRLGCKFSEEKHVALLARPLRSTGTIHFERSKGIARTTITPRPEQVVLTMTTLRTRKDQHTEEIPLDKSKDLKAFALVFPTLLRGDRAELERAFELGLYGSDRDWWALTFTPKSGSLRALVRRVTVFGRKGEITALQVIEASGDTTDTRLTEIRKNTEVPDAEIAAAFAMAGTPGTPGTN